MATYKTKDGTQSGFVPGVGVIVNGLLEVPDGVIFESSNFELVGEQSQQPTAPVAPAPSPSIQQAVPQIDPQAPKQIPIQSNQESN